MMDCVLEEADTAAISPFQYSGHIEIKWLNEGALFHTVPLFVLAQAKVSTELFIFNTHTMFLHTFIVYNLYNLC